MKLNASSTGRSATAIRDSAFFHLIGGRSGNRGRCAQPCRLPYEAYDKDNHRMGEPGDRYPLSPKDMCTVELLPEIVKSGIMSLKIEGRMKTALYVATVARTYRKAIDDYKKDPKLYEQNMPWYKEQISNCTYRQFTTGFFFGKPDETTQIYDSNTYNKRVILILALSGRSKTDCAG